jgi:hypothetical protein
MNLSVLELAERVEFRSSKPNLRGTRRWSGSLAVDSRTIARDGHADQHGHPARLNFLHTVVQSYPPYIQVRRP